MLETKSSILENGEAKRKESVTTSQNLPVRFRDCTEAVARTHKFEDEVRS